MKYLKHLEIRDSDEIDDKAMFKEVEKYHQALAKLRPRLSAAAWKYFSEGFAETGIHDARLVALTLGDGLQYEPFPWRTNCCLAKAEFINQNAKYRYFFKYRGIRRCSFDYDATIGQVMFSLDDPSRKFSVESWSLNHVMGDELTAADEKYLCHEFIFASRARLVIEAEKISFERRLMKKVPWPKTWHTETL